MLKTRTYIWKSNIIFLYDLIIFNIFLAKLVYIRKVGLKLTEDLNILFQNFREVLACGVIQKNKVIIDGQLIVSKKLINSDWETNLNCFVVYFNISMYREIRTTYIYHHYINRVFLIDIIYICRILIAPNLKFSLSFSLCKNLHWIQRIWTHILDKELNF